MITQLELRNLVKDYIKENNISIRRFSFEVEIDYSFIFKFIKGSRNLGFNNFSKIYNYLEKK